MSCHFMVTSQPNHRGFCCGRRFTSKRTITGWWWLVAMNFDVSQLTTNHPNWVSIIIPLLVKISQKYWVSMIIPLLTIYRLFFRGVTKKNTPDKQATSFDENQQYACRPVCTGGHKWVTNGSHCTVSVVAEEKATDSLPWRCSGKDVDSGINEIKVKTSVFFPIPWFFLIVFLPRQY